MIQIKASAPTRIDLIGGTLDIHPLTCLLQHKATVNAAVSLRAEVNLTIDGNSDRFQIISSDRDQFAEFSWDQMGRHQELALSRALLAHFWQQGWPGLRMELRASSPAGAGLGGSSTLAVVISEALCTARRMIIPDWPGEQGAHFLINQVRDIETRIIHCPAGTQDYWGAYNGGLNLIEFPPGGELVESLPIESLGSMKEQLLLCFSGQSRNSGINNWQIFNAAFGGDRKLIAKLEEIGELAELAVQAVRARNIEELFQLSAREWHLRQALCPGIDTEKTLRLARIGQEHGAQLSRVCGAGGGGVMAFFVDLSERETLAQALTSAGATVYRESGFDNQGVRVHNSQNPTQFARSTEGEYS